MYKLTLDGGLMRDHVLTPAIATLKTWQREGKIEIFETDRSETSSSSGWPGGRAEPAEGRRRRVAPKRDPKITAIFGRIATIICPMRDTHRLNMSELNDVNALLRHSTLGRTIFVTRNLAAFVDEEKQKKLQDLLQISVMTPEEVVNYLSQQEGWPTTSPDKE